MPASFYAHLYENKTVFDEKVILSQLPAGMVRFSLFFTVFHRFSLIFTAFHSQATELVYLMYKMVIESTPFFEGLPREAQTKLCLSMKPYPALAGDVIMTEGESGHEMFLIMKGKVAISKSNQVLGMLGYGSFVRGGAYRTPSLLPPRATVRHNVISKACAFVLRSLSDLIRVFVSRWRF